jgi:hypothetical protein
MEMDCVADVSEEHVASIMRVKVSRVYKCSCTYFVHSVAIKMPVSSQVRR